jgi:hypothetical protein
MILSVAVAPGFASAFQCGGDPPVRVFAKSTGPAILYSG